MSSATAGHPHIDLGETAQDLRTGLPDGVYEAMFLGPAPYLTPPVFRVGGATAPTDVDDYRSAHFGRVLRFPVGSGSVAVWARLRPSGSAAYVARRQVSATPVVPPQDQRHVDLSPSPRDLRTGLPDGNHVALVTAVDAGEAVLTYVGAAAPGDADDFWREGGVGARFVVCAGMGTMATWCRTTAGTGRINIVSG